MPPDLSPKEKESAIKSNTEKIKKSALKTIVGFLNTKGGTLLIGVADDKSIIGIEEDKLGDNTDKYMRSIDTDIKNRIGLESDGKVTIKFEKTDNKTICRIDCVPVPPDDPHAYLDQKLFFVRRSASSELKEGKEIQDYLRQRRKRT